MEDPFTSLDPDKIRKSIAELEELRSTSARSILELEQLKSSMDQAEYERIHTQASEAMVAAEQKISALSDNLRAVDSRGFLVYDPSGINQYITADGQRTTSLESAIKSIQDNRQREIVSKVIQGLLDEVAVSNRGRYYRGLRALERNSRSAAEVARDKLLNVTSRVAEAVESGDQDVQLHVSGEQADLARTEGDLPPEFWSTYNGYLTEGRIIEDRPRKTGVDKNQERLDDIVAEIESLRTSSEPNAGPRIVKLLKEKTQLERSIRPTKLSRR